MPPVSRSLEALLDLLDLEDIEVDLFRGRSPETSLQRVFGGQVAGQALVAAGRTVVPDRPVHSLHAYFVRPGDPAAPIVYSVDRIRDGRAFTTRRVVAIQHGRPIFNMSASFQVDEPGLEHQDPMPAAPPPESLPTMAGRMAADAAEWGDWWREWSSIDLRPVADSPRAAVPGAPDRQGHTQVWLRAASRLPDDRLLHVCVLAYVSDLTLLGATLVPHGVSMVGSGVQMASLDHAMWFHRPFRADEWLLYDQVTPSASGGRGFASGRIFTETGTLVASVVQEGLIRPPRAVGG
jgi:acyl-CoA thioesterase II